MPQKPQKPQKAQKAGSPKIVISRRVPTTDLKFPLAVLKGVIEQNDGSAYFGSLIGYPVWLEETRALGLIEQTELGRFGASALGQSIYDQGLQHLPKRGRAVGWAWPPELFEKAEKAIAQAEQRP
jgi:hypothetical protein